MLRPVTDTQKKELVMADGKDVFGDLTLYLEKQKQKAVGPYQIKRFHTVEENVDTLKRQPTEWGEICTQYIISKIK